MMAFIIISLIIGVIPAFIAQSKGKDFATWYVYGVFLFFFAMIHAIVLPENSKADYTRKAIQLSHNDDLYKPNTVDLNSPVEIVGHKIIGSTDDINCVIKFRNISDKTVVATKYIIECFNSFGEPVGDDNKIVSMVQDIVVSPRDCFGYDKVVKLSNHLDTRQIKVSVEKVMFDNGEVWESENPNIINIPTINLSDEELYNLKQVIDNEAVCYPSILEDKWMCICGRVNKDIDSCCVRCGRNLDEIKLYTKEYVEDKLKLIEKEEEEKKEVEKVQKEIMWEKNKKTIIIISVITGLIIAGFSVNHLIKVNKYKMSDNDIYMHEKLISDYDTITGDLRKASIDYSSNVFYNMNEFDSKIETGMEQLRGLYPPSKYHDIYLKLTNELGKYYSAEKLIKYQLYGNAGFDSSEMDVVFKSRDEADSQIKKLERKIKNKNYVPEEKNTNY